MSPTETEHGPELTVYRGWLDPGKHIWSPFVIKLEARLRFAGVRYETKGGSLRDAPRGKIPYAELRERGSDSVILADSTLIIKHLVERDILPNINAQASSPTVRAQDLAIRALFEEKLYFYHAWERWTQNYYAMRDRLLSALIYPKRVIIGLLLYRHATQMLHDQGTGRYTAAEIRVFRSEIWEAINGLLISSRARATVNGAPNDQPFWVLEGDHPTEADATVFGFIVSVLVCTANPESQQLVKQFPAILDYAGRIHDRYFPDYAKWE
ncbi:hypothetical protein C8Q69DRAFT_65575 [Paecilomyces variotii]|uniref:Thioredoxin-like fold domain-containing protein n=1 Tax=Byssochlamys spectabilis TaxID=264951 RepID=A0A443HN70_BYSSP|nr:hypothetical protein C8Q69DRAFT_65575 [Paecilomyces variotii]KAJ9220445.1 hypothetical protein DTO169C6_7189 [Paecilomyces variotii]KAJ9241312.1 hypothetical protein DTO169E5_3512 [Paecilomyces variotii]KAJ9246962.1 hypothetical protein DTO207G8_8422 [Paecilomyces variotii]KAJ9289746.1 hypothetical protein DTO021C3_2817 [Paecilomyces variotii]KAJ9363379.1 hypothetical protein DTO280E4_2787 [Paecilomyces variotii]